MVPALVDVTLYEVSKLNASSVALLRTDRALTVSTDVVL